MSSPKVAIIIPAYNAELWIARCIISCLNQDYDNLEIIVIDDGSTDSTKEKLMEFSDCRLKIHHINNVGVSKARKIGIEKSSGDFIYFVDSDDYIERNAISSLINEGVRKNADVIISQAKYIKKESIGVTSFEIYDDPIRAYLNGVLPTTLWPVLFKRQAIESSYIESSFAVSEDYIIMSNIFMLPVRVILVNKFLYNYVKHGNSATSNLTMKKYEDNYNAHQYVELHLFERLDATYRVDRAILNLNFLYNLIVIDSPFTDSQCNYIANQFGSKEIKNAKIRMSMRKKIILSLKEKGILYYPVLKVLLSIMKGIRKYNEK